MSTSKLSESVAKSWEDSDIRSRRSERHNIRCNGERFASFTAALRHFGIPDPTNKHIRIRGLLTSGQSVRETWVHEGKEYVFELADHQEKGESGAADSDMTKVIRNTSSDMITSRLNQILYGPPGTGKTYQTIEKALEILDPEFLAENQERSDLKRRFDELVEAQRIAFVTFHQSFSYEDFVEGLRAKVENGQLCYEVEDGVFKRLCERARKSQADATSETYADATNEARFVLIIDEINRGNVSRIFGELITLIEPSKRFGAEESLEVVLPYSKDLFSVPGNLHIIGTMNTADRSLAALDLALRRRFTFVEMPPKPELLKDVVIESEEGATVNVGHLLQAMNQRISVLLDRDHSVGHAYFMSLIDDPRLERLTAIFRYSVLPLLQEYFFEDWQHIRWVLNDHRKAIDYQIVQECTADLDQLFGVDIGARQDALEYRINADALERIEAYWGIGGDDGDGGDNPNDADRVKREATHSGRVIRQLASGTIKVLKDGQLQKTAMSHLREVAGALGISVTNDGGSPHNTRQLGKQVIDAILGQQ